MLPYLRIGPLLLQTPGLAILAGLWLGTMLAEKRAARMGLNASAVSNLIMISLAAGVTGARLAYAARYLNIYLENPLSLFSLNTNTLSPFDGVLIGLAAAGLYLVRKNLSLMPVLDALAPGLAIFMVGLGVAHILSGEAYGAPTRLPWSVFLWGDYRHPTQIYETAVALVIFYVIWKKPLGQLGSGLTFLGFTALTALARIFLETFRGDSMLTAGIRTAQLVGLAALAVSLWLIDRKLSSPARDPLPSGMED